MTKGTIIYFEYVASGTEYEHWTILRYLQILARTLAVEILRQIPNCLCQTDRQTDNQTDG